MSNRSRSLVALFLVVWLTACGNSEAPTPEPTPTIRPTATRPAPTATAPPPTATPEPPAAARVNGQAITLEAFERELARYEEGLLSLGLDPAGDGDLHEAELLDALIEQLLIEQAAAQEGVIVSDEAVEAEMQRLMEEKGQNSFDEWLEMNQYSAEEFSALLRSGMINQAMIERVAAAVPDAMEQVHARHIVVETIDTGRLVLAKLQEGTDFATLAVEYSLDESTRPDGGDLGFFPRGLLLAPKVEEVAFSLEVGASSELIESDFGYHIVQVLERDPARPVAPEVRDHLCRVAFERWLQELWMIATVEREI